MTMITPSYLGETIEYSSLHACRSTLEDPTICRFTFLQFTCLFDLGSNLIEMAGTCIEIHHFPRRTAFQSAPIAVTRDRISKELAALPHTSYPLSLSPGEGRGWV